jgi:hypothetical protein
MMKRISLLCLILLFAGLTGCSNLSGQQAAEGGVLRVRDIRAKGFTLEWTGLPADRCEIAIAASSGGFVEDYETAAGHDKVVLEFTPAAELDGMYRVTGLMPGRDYEIKLFIRGEGAERMEVFSAEASLPYMSSASVQNIYINGNLAHHDVENDHFSYIFLPGTVDETEPFTFTYMLARGCSLYIGGVKNESGRIPLTLREPLEITVVHEATQAARDYTVFAGSADNGIPIVFVDTLDGREIDCRYEYISAQMRIIDSSVNPYGTGLYWGPVTIKGRGNSSWHMPKKGYNFTIGNNAQILDMTRSNDWLLIANYSDKSLMRNFTAYEFSRDLGADFAPKLRFVDLVLNGEYVGTYNIGERIKIRPGRLDFPRIRAGTADEYELTGSYVLEVNSRDKWDPHEVIFETPRINLTRRDHFISIKQPGAHNLPPAAYEYIKNYFTEAENALFGNDFKDPEIGYRAYIDTASVIDWLIVNEVYKNCDATFHTSVYFYKPRGEKLHMGPVWDFDIGGGNIDYAGCYDPHGWHVRNSEWMRRMFEDEAFVMEFIDRWNYIMDNGYFDRFFQRIGDTAELLEKSQRMNFRRWPILGVYVWPNAANVHLRTTYMSEVDYLRNWLTRRVEWLDREIRG